MNETQKTLMFAGFAVVLGLLALVAAPGNPTPGAFYDKGEIFFPDFTDPNVATSLEVFDFDEETGATRPFKVLFQAGKWTIPSHHDYPADGKDRLARTAAGAIDIKRDDILSDNTSDHEALGVLDPLDETNTTLTGRGKRVTIKDKSNNVLADLIIGRQVEGRDKFHYVRIPGQKRTYAARIDLDISTVFSDWIEKDVLLVDKDKIKQITLKDYTINERTGRLNQRDTIVLTKNDETWRANRMAAGQEVDATKTDELLKALDELSIVGVRPKPDGLSQSLARIDLSGISISRSDALSLQSKGYYFTHDGQLVSNEGETQVRTEDGVVYTLRFGEVVFGAGEAVTAGTGVGNDASRDQGENRYLFITTEFDAQEFPEPKRPGNLGFQSKPDSLWTGGDRRNSELQKAYEAWEKKIAQGGETSSDLNTRFAKWYYVISSDSFDQIHLRRSDLVKRKSS